MGQILTGTLHRVGNLVGTFVPEDGSAFVPLYRVLLDMGRLETGTLSLNAAPVDISEVLEEARRNVLARGARWCARSSRTCDTS